MAINRKFLCKQYARTVKNIVVSKHFMAFLSSHYPCKNTDVYLVLPILQTFAINLRVIHDTTSYTPYLRWSHGEKSSWPIEMYVCVFKMIVVEHDHNNSDETSSIVSCMRNKNEIV